MATANIVESAGNPAAAAVDEVEMIPLNDIWEHGDFQNRLFTDDSQVDIYVDKLKHTECPPVELWKITDYENPDQLWLVHGHHRFLAYSKAKKEKIPAKVGEGTWSEAIMASCLSNLQNGLSLTKGDIENACKRFIAAQASLPGKPLSNRKIAKLFGIHNTTVGQYKKDLAFEAQLEEKGLQPGCRVELVSGLAREPLKWRLGKFGFVGAGEERNRIYVVFDYNSGFDSGWYNVDDFVFTDREKIVENIHSGDYVWDWRISRDHEYSCGVVVCSPQSDVSYAYYSGEVSNPWNLSSENEDYLVLFSDGLKSVTKDHLELQVEEYKNWANDGIDWQFVYNSLIETIKNEPEGIAKEKAKSHLEWVWQKLGNSPQDFDPPFEVNSEEVEAEANGEVEVEVNGEVEVDEKVEVNGEVEANGKVEVDGKVEANKEVDVKDKNEAGVTVDDRVAEFDFAKTYTLLDADQRSIFVNKQAQGLSVYFDRDLTLLKESIEQEIASRSLNS